MITYGTNYSTSAHDVLFLAIRNDAPGLRDEDIIIGSSDDQGYYSIEGPVDIPEQRSRSGSVHGFLRKMMIKI